jgi:hypothetical protein
MCAPISTDKNTTIAIRVCTVLLNSGCLAWLWLFGAKSPAAYDTAGVLEHKCQSRCSTTTASTYALHSHLQQCTLKWPTLLTIRVAALYRSPREWRSVIACPLSAAAIVCSYAHQSPLEGVYKLPMYTVKHTAGTLHALTVYIHRCY